MKQKETTFLAQECLPKQQNILSPRFDELIPICSSENVMDQPFEEAIKKKRGIFEKKNFRALNEGHKSDNSVIDQNQSNVSQNDICLDSSRLKSNSFDYQIKNPDVLGNDLENQVTPFRRGLTGQILNSTLNLNGQVVKSLSKIDQYQSFVNKIEQQEDKIKKQELYDQQKSSETKEQLQRRASGRREGTVGLNPIWAQKGLSIIRLVSRFIQQLKTKTETIKFRLITQKIYSVIGDLSSNFEYILISHQIKQKPSLLLVLKYNFQKRAMKYLHYFENIQEFLSKNIIVIRPDSKFKILWDIVLLLFIVMNIFYIPINISFNVTTSGAFEYLFDLLPSWIFIAEIIINFNTAYYDKGLMHEDRKSIVKHYLKGNFFWDLLVVVPFLISQLNIPYVRYSLLIRLTRLQPLMESIEEMLNLEENLQIVVDLFKLIFFLVLTGHFCGCAWHFVALTEYESGITRNWLTDYELNAFDYHWFDRYIISLYWSVITTVTVGYGDIIPVTTIERIFVIIVTLLLCGVFGYSISNIGNIFKQLSEKKSMYKFKLRQIHSHIRKRGLNLNLSLKVKKYFEYYFQLEQEEENHADEFLSQLTKHLREEVLTDLYSNTLKKSRFLRDNFNEITINNLSQFVKEKKILPEEVLYSRFEQPKKLWFVLSGSLEFVADHKNENDYFEATETFLKKVTSGSVLGEREFITQQTYQYKVRAVKFTQLAYIDYEDFITVISENDEEYETFCLKRDQLLFNPATKGSGNICEICEWTHNFIQCPFIFLQPNINKIANKFTSVQLNNRIKFPFRHSTKYRTKDYLSKVQENALRMIVGNLTEQEYTDEYLISLGFQLSPYTDADNPMADDLMSESNMNDSKSPTSSDKQYIKELQKKSTKTQLGLTTDLKESKDLELGNQLRKSIINFKRIQFGKERTRAYQIIKKENEKIHEQLENSQMLSVPHQQTNKLSMVQNLQRPRKSSNFDDFGFIQVSQKLGCLVKEMNQQEQDSKYYMKSSSKYSEGSGRKQSLLKQQDSIAKKQGEEIKEIKSALVGEHRRKKRKTTIQLQQQKDQRKSYQKQQSGLSPVMQQVQQQQQQLQQLQQVLETKLKRGSFLENQKKLGQTTQLNSSGLIEYTGELKENNATDNLQQKIFDIVHTNVECQIDVCKQTLVYDIEFNIETVLRKIEKYYLELRAQEKKQFKRTKSNNRNLFERIKPIKNVTIKSIQNTNKSQTDAQKVDEILNL